jgi:hypothetical protein
MPPSGGMDNTAARDQKGERHALLQLNGPQLDGAEQGRVSGVCSTPRGGCDHRRHADYVDLRTGQPLAGVFGAVDQIFPHELGHVILRQLAGDAPPGGCNQVHAVSLRTNSVRAFDEGFAGHLQVMAVDDLEADPATRALAGDAAAERRMDQYLSRYLAEVACDPWPGGGLIENFLSWFGQVEQAERYYAVRKNRFAWEAPMPEHLLHGGDPYRAYLVESIVPGRPGDRSRSPAQAFHGSTDFIPRRHTMD